MTERRAGCGMDQSNSLNTDQSCTQNPYHNISSHQTAVVRPTLVPFILNFHCSTDQIYEQTAHPNIPIVSSTNHPHFAMIYSNQEGQIAFESSPSIADPQRMIFTPDIQERFAELVSPRTSTLAGIPSESQSKNHRKTP